MSTPYDTLSTARRLEAAGIATKQAEAIVFAIQESRDTAATKRDLDSNVAALRSDLEASTAALRSEIAANTAALRSDLEANTAALRSEIAAQYGRVAVPRSRPWQRNCAPRWANTGANFSGPCGYKAPGLAGIVLASKIF